MSSPSASSRPRRHWLLRLFYSVLRIVVLLLIVLVLFQSKLIYFPAPYAREEVEEFTQSHGKRLSYETGCGKQSAWLIPPADGKRVDHLWIVCSGNGARALDMSEFCRALPFPGDAWLLVDYPGYGECEGSPSPDAIRENLRAIVPLAAKELDLSAEELPQRTCVFGHSLGCAAGLIAAEEFKLQRAVLCAPFTSMMDMTQVVLKVPLGFIVHHRFDNRARLASLRDAGGHAWIFHGASDEVIPVEMGRTLAAEFGVVVTFQEIPGADHNRIVPLASQKIIAAMGEASRR